ncbi:MAG: site-2 protease family protein [Pirellulales bacterium]|nr:site-2 protease family protein [Pirellulales bacterium]
MTRRRVLLPLVLLVATAVSTFWAGATHWMPGACLDGFASAGQALWEHWPDGLAYAAAVLGILFTHEMGHFLAAWWHGIPASFPYFLPVPFTPFGTMGAVIRMRGHGADRRAMFDLGVAGPLAGLAVALPITWLGIRQMGPPVPGAVDIGFYNPLVFTLLIDRLRPELAGDSMIYLSQLNPLLMAGWVGMFVTGLNMLPISQLDGGHVAYALLGRRAHHLARMLLVAAIIYVLVAEKYMWVVLIVLVCLMGADHPATADDRVPLGRVRAAIGWVALTLPFFCFSPRGIGEVIW